MNKHLKLAAVSALALIVASPIVAESNIAGITGLNEKIDDITSDVNDEMTRGDDAERFGPNGVVQGWRGSFALSASGTSGNTDTGEVTGAGRLSYGVGDWNHLFGFALEYGESNGTKSEEKAFLVYEGSRYFSSQLYAFGLGRFEYDGYLTDATGTEIPGHEADIFVGGGLGYRILNNENQTWRVQAGPGVRYVRDVAGTSDTEVGAIIGSRYYFAFNDTISFTMDTDILGSKANITASNDAGFNFKMSDNLSTRLSYRTDFNSDPGAGLDKTDNTIGVSLVLSF